MIKIARKAGSFQITSLLLKIKKTKYMYKRLSKKPMRWIALVISHGNGEKTKYVALIGVLYISSTIDPTFVHSG